LCDDCARSYAGQVLCEHCADELEFAVLSRPTFAERVRESLASFRNTLAVVAIVVVLAAGAFYLLRPLMNQPISPEEFARFRYAASGGFKTPEGINSNSTVLGAKIVSFTSDRPGYEVKHLINEYTGENYPGWRTAAATFPQDVVVSHDQITGVSKIVLWQQANEPMNTWVKRFEVAVSNDGPNTGFTKIGEWEAKQETGIQRFVIPSVTSKWIRLTILSNYGSTEYTSLSKFEAYDSADIPGAPPTSPPQN
jgi:hypothetical protein